MEDRVFEPRNDVRWWGRRVYANEAERDDTNRNSERNQTSLLPPSLFRLNVARSHHSSVPPSVQRGTIKSSSDLRRVISATCPNPASMSHLPLSRLCLLNLIWSVATAGNRLHKTLVPCPLAWWTLKFPYKLLINSNISDISGVLVEKVMTRVAQSL